MTWVEVCTVRTLDGSLFSAFQIQGFDILLTRYEGQILAMENLCPHEDAFLHKGCLVGDYLQCPLHGWQFHIETGNCLTDDNFDLPHYPVKILEDKVWLELPISD